ncbi:MAG: oligosaccharide flippase family protein [Bacteroidales bacterium]
MINKFTKVVSSEHLRGASWVLIGNAMIRSGSLLLTFILARFIGVEALGRFSITKSTVFTVTMVLGYIVSTSGAKFISQETDNKEVCLEWSNFLISLSLLVHLVLGVLFFVLSERLSLYFFGNNSSVRMFRLASMLFPFVGLSTVSQGIIMGAKEFRVLGICNSLISLISVPLAVVFCLKGGGDGAMLGLVIAYIIEASVKLGVVSRVVGGISIRWRGMLSNTRELLNFSTPLFLIAMITGPFSYLYKVLLLKTANGVYELGIYEAIVQWNVVIMMITGAISTTSLPILNREYQNSSKRIFRQSVKEAMFVNIASGGGLMLVFLLFSKIILGLYGEEFLSYHSTFIIVILSTVFNSLTWSIDKIFYSINLQWKSLIMFGVSTGVTVVLFLLLKDVYGIFGLALAQLLGWVSASLTGVIILRRWI